MSRIHLFEWEDFNWFPSSIRNFGTDILQFIANKGNIYKPTIPLLINALQKSKSNIIIDLGSGGGGGLLRLNKELLKHNSDLRIVLTDYFPNLPAFKKNKLKYPNIDYIETPVDAKKVPINIKGLRTQFLSFHHFKPKDAKLILQNAINSKQSIAIIEAQERSILNLITLFFMPVLIFLITPFIAPFSLKRIMFTYLIPIVPFFVWWDGLVSCLRTYSVKEMQELVNGLENKESFYWEIGKKKTYFGVNMHLIGILKNKQNNES